MENPTHLTLLGKSYPIRPLLYFTKREDHPFIIVNDCPIASISMRNLEPYLNSIKLAEVSLKSFLKSNGKYSISPISEFSSFFDQLPVNKKSTDAYYDSQLKDFDISFINKPNIKIEEYCIFGKRQLFVSSDDEHFNIWDKSLIKEILIKHQENQLKLGQLPAAKASGLVR